MRDFRKIKAWHLADDLAVEVYGITKAFPKEEMFAPVSQLRRAAYSVPSNVAEGTGRRTVKDFLRFLDISKGSINEVQYFLNLSGRLNYLSAEESIRLSDLADEVSRCLTGYIKAVESDRCSMKKKKL